jgi:hypothetical protein
VCCKTQLCRKRCREDKGEICNPEAKSHQWSSSYKKIELIFLLHFERSTTSRIRPLSTVKTKTRCRSVFMKSGCRWTEIIRQQRRMYCNEWLLTGHQVHKPTEEELGRVQVLHFYGLRRHRNGVFCDNSRDVSENTDSRWGVIRPFRTLSS